jgi:hypothetical protein
MMFELIFLACSLFGAFCIGLFSALVVQRGRQQSWEDALTETHRQLRESREAQEYSEGRAAELRERLAAAVDPAIYMALRDRYDLLEYKHIELERQVALGVHPDWEHARTEWQFLEQVGVAITGEVPPQERDDLCRVRGISPYLQDKLNRLGLLTYDQIARLSDDQVRMVNDAIEVLPGRIRREDWVGQCRLFMQSAGHQSPHP